MSRGRYVFDTNVIVSALLLSESLPGQLFRKALAEGTVLVSAATISELHDVLSRPKFDPYITREERDAFLASFLDRAELVEVTHRVDACRDLNDNKFLELALSGDATAVVTGDDDLLVLDPFQEIPIRSAAAILQELQDSGS